MEYYASLETGGTKCVCSIGTNPDDLIDIKTIPTTVPDKTIPLIHEYFDEKFEKYTIKSLGITSFGPIDINPKSHKYGYITLTPKLAWRNFDLVASMKKYGVPIAFDTDVNGAALAEGAWGSARGHDTYSYITLGTGIGVGIVVNNTTLHGMLHPEGGHMILTTHPDDPSEGYCPSHKNCWEGLACGPSMEKRWNCNPADIPDEHIAWEIEAHYIALGIVNIILLASPQKIILGGGLSKRASIFPKIHNKVQIILNDYIQTDDIQKNIQNYIVPPTLEHSGLLGGIIIAKHLS